MNTQARNIDPIRHLRISGYLGQRVDTCIEYRVKVQDVGHLMEPFRHKEETLRWQSGFWGRWIQGVITSYRYDKGPKLYKIIKNGTEPLMETQLPNGYIGNCSEEAQLDQQDIWGRRYTALGLIAYYDLSGDRRALDAAYWMIDHLMTQVGPGKANIVATGNYIEMPDSSVLEPMMYLYNRTRQDKYLDFAKYIIKQQETPEGPQLISKTIANIPVAGRFPHPKIWFSPENGQKAYETMSCYEGLLELYRVTKNPLYLSVVEKTMGHIIDERINVTGSGSTFECWYGGKALQTCPTYHTMEACATFTWMQICNRMLGLTGNSLYADQIEKAMYNTLLASLKADASQIAKYGLSEGWRHEGEEQCGIHTNCCNASGPHAFAMIPQSAYRINSRCIDINLYAALSIEVELDKKTKVSITQETSYPIDGQARIVVEPEKMSDFTIALHIPAWSEWIVVSISGEPLTDLLVGAYLPIRRTWEKGDEITVELDMRARLVELNKAQAIVRGPLVLARDSRFKDEDVDKAFVIVSKDGYVELTPVRTPDLTWMAFIVPMVLGADLEGNGRTRPVHLYDFVSVGNTWSQAERCRVWLPKTWNVMHTPYKPY